jgi:hypothetical protein
MSSHGFTSETIFDLSSELSETIKGLDPPTLSYACPIDDCPIWHARVTKVQYQCVNLTPLAETRFIRRHRKDHCDDIAACPKLNALFAPEASFKCRYIYRPYGSNVRSILMFKEDWKPSAPVVPSVRLPSRTIPILRIDSHVSPSAKFLQILRYPHYIQDLNANEWRLRQLVQLPDRAAAKRLKHASTRYMELGLCDLSDSLPSYLRDANAWLDEQHPEVRDVFVHK